MLSSNKAMLLRHSLQIDIIAKRKKELTANPAASAGGTWRWEGQSCYDICNVLHPSRPRGRFWLWSWNLEWVLRVPTHAGGPTVWDYLAVRKYELVNRRAKKKRKRERKQARYIL